MSAATVGLAVIGVTSLTTSALFSDNDSAAGSGFTTGSVDVTLTPGVNFLAIDNMAPGDTQYRTLTVNNPGSLGYRYSVVKTWEDSNAAFPLSGVLQIATFALPATSECSATTAVEASSVRALDTVAAGGPVLLGDQTPGFQAGDRELLSAASELLCFQITLPTTVGNDYQLSTSTVAVQVFAEQTTNNP